MSDLLGWAANRGVVIRFIAEESRVRASAHLANDEVATAYAPISGDAAAGLDDVLIQLRGIVDATDARRVIRLV